MKLELKILEVENGYVIIDCMGSPEVTARKWVAETLPRAAALVEQLGHEFHDAKKPEDGYAQKAP